MSENNRHRRVASQMAERYGVDPEIYNRLIAKESSWNPNAKGSAGEVGYTQIMAATGANPGFGVTPIKDRSDPIDNLRFGAEYLGALIEYYNGDYTKALMAYNGGAGNDQDKSSSDAKKYAAEVLSGKEVQTKPEPRPTGLVLQAEDKKGMDAISKGIEELLAPKRKRIETCSYSEIWKKWSMSPLEGTGIPVWEH